MKRVLPWLGLGLLAAAVGGTTFGCSSTNASSPKKGGGVLVEGGPGGSGGSGGNGTGGNGTGGNGTGGNGTGGGTSSTKLGAQCDTDAQCAPDFKCVTVKSNDFGNGGPSRGYCTKTCTKTSECTALASGSQCVGFGAKAYCLQGCNPAKDAVNVCQGRYDAMCLGLQQTDADGGIIDGGKVSYACLPECATDNDCGGTRKCDLRSGLCSDNPNTGLPIGSPCNPQAKTDPCEGFCIHNSKTDQTVGSCTAVCNNSTNSSYGFPGGCGSNPVSGSPQDAACVFAGTTTTGVTLGICGQLCDCNNDCRSPNEVCQSWAAGGANPSQNVKAFHRAGACVSTTGAEGGVVTGISTCPSTGDSGTGGSGTGGSGTGGSGTGGSGTGGSGTGGSGTGGSGTGGSGTGGSGTGGSGAGGGGILDAGLG